MIGDCLEQMKELKDNSVEAIVTDPPYGLSFMGKKWDCDVPSVEIWREALRVLKPGGHLLAFGGTRTYHRLAVNIEDAGFEIRDQIMWLYGSGFPKSMDVSKAIDKAAGAEREIVGNANRAGSNSRAFQSEKKTTARQYFETVPSTDAAKQWQGWGTSLKPAAEIICLATKPLTGAVLIDNLVRECQSLLFALIAKNHSASNQSAFGTELNTAQWIAGKITLTPDVLSEAMVTLRSESEKHSNLNIELSWLDILEETSQLANTFTTEMESSLTTDLKILKSCLLKRTPPNTLQNDGLGKPLSASPVGSLLSALEQKLNFIQTPSVHEPATSKAIALSPNVEPICLARKPLEKGLTVAQNVQKYGTGAINVDASRIGSEERPKMIRTKTIVRSNSMSGTSTGKTNSGEMTSQGRWPANVIFDEEAAAMLDEQIGFTKSSAAIRNNKDSESVAMFGSLKRHAATSSGHSDSGGASRFFYCSKASKSEKNSGCEGTPKRAVRRHNAGIGEGLARAPAFDENFHPTVKPIKLMEYLIKMVTPPNGTVLDPFMGSGSTGVAAKSLGFAFIGIEMNPEYAEIARKRLE
jgi:DNA modification methylase